MLSSVVLAFFVSFLLPISFYTIPPLFGVAFNIHRDEQIGKRLILTCGVTLFLLVFHFAIWIPYTDTSSYYDMFHPNVVVSVIKTLLLNTVLFSIPILHAFCNGYSFRNLICHLSEMLLLTKQPWKEKLKTIRNIWVGPFCEEVIYRMILIDVLYEWSRIHSNSSMGSSRGMSIFVASIFFGVSHLHHLWQRVVHEQLSVTVACLQSVIQLIYTTIFGLYTGYVYVKSDSVFCCFVLHAYCNAIGLPDFAAIVQDHRYGKQFRIGLIVSVVVFFILFTLYY